MKSYHDAFENGFLTKTQKQGVLCLIPKKGKDLTKLESWRPLSILNTDYKILAKVLAKRLKLGLNEIINPDQIGYMEGRFCGENIRLIADMIEFCKINKTNCIILLADFEKAFDKINWNFLHNCLGHFGFGDVFRKWISILYCDIESCVTNNGHQSEYFKISRGIRQGCPLSALLFLLPAEIIALILRSLGTIKGIMVSNTCIKLCQLADDMTLFLSDNSSVYETIQTFEEFYRYAGLKLNKSKTIGIIVQNDGNLYEDELLGISWQHNTFKTLGTHFALNHEQSNNLNIKEKLATIKSILNSWQARGLTLMGKITVLKALVVPHVNILASILQADRKLVNDLDAIIFQFLWNKKRPLIAKHTIIQPIDLGGLKMISIPEIFKTTKIMWIKRLSNNVNAKWKILAYHLMGIKSELLFKKLHFSSIQSCPKSNFYKDLLQIWFGFISIQPTNFDELLQEPLFHNDVFQIGGSYIYSDFLDWKRSGIELVGDILSKDGHVLAKAELESKYTITIPHLKYRQIVSSLNAVSSQIPKITSITTEKNNKIQRQCLQDIQKVTSQQVCGQYVKALYQIPTSQNKWIEYYPFLEKLSWKQIYLLPSKIVKATNLRSLQYRILHRFFNCNYKLFLWGLKESPACLECNVTDNLEHYFYYCDSVKSFWTKVEQWMNEIFSTNYNLAILDVLFGCLYVEKTLYYAINLILLYGKYFINKCKLGNKNLSWGHFQHMLKSYLSISQFSYVSQGQENVFNDKFGILSAKL